MLGCLTLVATLQIVAIAVGLGVRAVGVGYRLLARHRLTANPSPGA